MTNDVIQAIVITSKRSVRGSPREKRNTLSDESTHASTVFGSWCGSQHNIVPQEEILTMFKNKSKWLGKGNVLCHGRDVHPTWVKSNYGPHC